MQDHADARPFGARRREIRPARAARGVEAQGSDSHMRAALAAAGLRRRGRVPRRGGTREEGGRGGRGVRRAQPAAGRQGGAGRGVCDRERGGIMTTAQATGEVTYLEAISQALAEEMARDERVFLMGEDIGVYGGAFKITEGFLETYGEWRVLDTPLSESGIVGAAIGAAMMGLRPVVEMQFADFISCAFDQITEVAAKNHYRWGAAVPLVIRAPFGGGVHGGPFHSECPEGWFFHSPGLKLVAPSTPYDAKGLLKAAIRDPNPVIYFEHKFLYRRVKAVLPQEDFIVPIGKAEVKRTGDDITVVTYGATVHLALEAAELLAKEGIDLEIVDL